MEFPATPKEVAPTKSVESIRFTAPALCAIALATLPAAPAVCIVSEIASAPGDIVAGIEAVIPKTPAPVKPAPEVFPYVILLSVYPFIAFTIRVWHCASV